jgi:ubiquinone/menaquinone biosynthesis C-methylase UbiE
MSHPESKPTSPMQLPSTWDAVASGYAEIMLRHTAYAEQALDLAELVPSDRVLDVGTGPGLLALLAARRAAQVSAVDFSPAMVEQLVALSARDGVKNIDTGVMDAQSLAFPDASFDAAFSLFVFMFIPDRARAFLELRRVLRPGGRAVVATWAPIERRPLMKIGFDALAEVLPELPGPQKGDLQTPEDCVREMSAAGFRDVTVKAFSASVQIESAEHYLDVMERSGAPFVMLKKRFGEQAWTDIQLRLTEAVRRRLPDGPTDLTAEALLTRGLR